MEPRQRTGRLLFGGAAMGATGYFAGLAAAPLAAEDLTGAVTWSGLPGAMGIVGTALGASLVTGLLRRLGRRNGLTIGYATAVVGAALAVVAMRSGAFGLLLVGTLLFGVGHAANQLTRYVVAELHTPDRRGRALGWIVWAGTIGGVIGPNLLAPAGRGAESAGLPALAGPYVVGLVAMAAVGIVYQFVLRPDPGTLAVAETLDDEPSGERTPASAWRLPTVRVAIAVMVTGQVVMVWLMSMTPVHIREGGGDLGRVGLILSAHILGMYALAPLAGWVEDRFGSLAAIVTALTTLAGSAVLAAVSPVGGVAMGAALFLLGLGWSFAFVAGSTMLARGVPATIRARVQGRVDTAVFLASAGASLAAGLLLDALGYVGLCVVALLALVLPTVFVWRSRRILTRRAEPVAV
ncbi:MAG: MFS transporter [Actinobacteria bacterium]|jgi:MFS family permease|nr:MFS transporter [Actinomycetota bacterium]